MGNFIASKLELLKNFLPFLRKLAGFPPSAEVELYEEVKYLPTLMITHMGGEAQATDFSANSLDDGDILIIQESLTEVFDRVFGLHSVMLMPGKTFLFHPIGVMSNFKLHLSVEPCRIQYSAKVRHHKSS